MVKQTNFYGSSDYSLPSEPLTYPKPASKAGGGDGDDDDDDDDKQHCPLFMAGFCPRFVAQGERGREREVEREVERGRERGQEVEREVKRSREVEGEECE